MDLFKTLAQEFGIKEEQVEATVALIDEGNTIPFISRYRKEVTGSLDDATLRDLPLYSYFLHPGHLKDFLLSTF